MSFGTTCGRNAGYFAHVHARRHIFSRGALGCFALASSRTRQLASIGTSVPESRLQPWMRPRPFHCPCNRRICAQMIVNPGIQVPETEDSQKMRRLWRVLSISLWHQRLDNEWRIGEDENTSQPVCLDKMDAAEIQHLICAIPQHHNRSSLGPVEKVNPNAVE